MLKVLVFEKGKPAEIRTIEDTLQAKQELVGGYIQAVALLNGPVGYSVVMNEEGKLDEEWPEHVSGVLKTESGAIYDVLAGTAFVVRDSNDEWGWADVLDEDVDAITNAITPFGWRERLNLVFGI
jgi:hypothetical protein